MSRDIPKMTGRRSPGLEITSVPLSSFWKVECRHPHDWQKLRWFSRWALWFRLTESSATVKAGVCFFNKHLRGVLFSLHGEALWVVRCLVSMSAFCSGLHKPTTKPVGKPMVIIKQSKKMFSSVLEWNWGNFHIHYLGQKVYLVMVPPLSADSRQAQ